MSDIYAETPTVQAALTRAAVPLREAITAAKLALEAAEEGSDEAARCNELLTDLESALRYVEWKPSAEDRGSQP
jgi:hypothetical protein